jgi:anti-anti-sigma factor
MSEILKQENQTIVKPGMDVVASMAEDFKNELLSVINEGTSEVVIDLDGVEMVDSVGIGVIIAAHNSLSQSGKKLKVINVTNDVYGLFTTMRLNRRFTVEPAS